MFIHSRVCRNPYSPNPILGLGEFLPASLLSVFVYLTRNRVFNLVSAEVSRKRDRLKKKLTFTFTQLEYLSRCLQSVGLNSSCMPTVETSNRFGVGNGPKSLFEKRIRFHRLPDFGPLSLVHQCTKTLFILFMSIGKARLSGGKRGRKKHRGKGNRVKKKIRGLFQFTRGS